MRHSSFEDYGVFPPGAGRVTLGEVKAEWVDRDEDESDVEGLGRKWTSIVHEPEGLRVHGASFDVFARSEEAAGDRFFKAAGDFVELMIQSARLGFSRGDQQAQGGLARISFHWSDERMAVVSADSDAIHILSLGGESELEWERPALKSNKMTNINAIAFRPFSGSTIAAGCERGIAIWRRREVSYLIRRAHTQVCGLDWTRDGSLLASASPNERSVVLWDVGSKEASPLQSIQGGARLASWSPHDCKPMAKRKEFLSRDVQPILKFACVRYFTCSFAWSSFVAVRIVGKKTNIPSVEEGFVALGQLGGDVRPDRVLLLEYGWQYSHLRSGERAGHSCDTFRAGVQ